MSFLHAKSMLDRAVFPGFIDFVTCPSVLSTMTTNSRWIHVTCPSLLLTVMINSRWIQLGRPRCIRCLQVNTTMDTRHVRGGCWGFGFRKLECVSCCSRWGRCLCSCLFKGTKLSREASRSGFLLCHRQAALPFTFSLPHPGSRIANCFKWLFFYYFAVVRAHLPQKALSRLCFVQPHSYCT